MNQYQTPNYPYVNRFNNYYPWQYPMANSYAVSPEPSISQNNTPTLKGMAVNSVNDITADSVPMDGSAALFPLRDLSEIYVKRWNSDGTIKTVTYKPMISPKVESSVTETKSVESLLGDRLTELSNKLDRLEQSINKMRPKNPNVRKEGSI